ncbi:transcriptional regulator, LuxR family [Mycolicibacterium rhodesiae JS60]|nr:transcriptional regulator, LuxR family [Mycolicibacterium rhodesiae JS60]
MAHGVVADFLDRAERGPAALVLEGEAGIGKSTRWLNTLDEAREAGFLVLSTYCAMPDVTLAFAPLADLLRDIDAAMIDSLPGVQRLALQRAKSGWADGPATDEHMVAAGFLALVEQLSQTTPVVVAIDDAQWLDSASRTVIAYATRRFAGRVGVLATLRTGDSDTDQLAWLRTPRPDMLVRDIVRPMGLGALHAMISSRLGRSLSRPVVTRIHRVSGGNPFYALELARTLDQSGASSGASFPGTLGALVRERVGDLGEEVGAVLLVIALVAEATTELLAKSTGLTIDRIVEMVDPLEEQGIIRVDGRSVRFAHPLLAAGVEANAAPSQRRSAHRSVAAAVAEPELRARHLALGSAAGDPDTLAALDAAAAATQAKGAPATAAELLDLAIRLGGDTPIRRLLAATHHFTAGDADKARAVLAPAVAELAHGVMRSMALVLLAGICIYQQGFDEADTHLAQAVNGAAGNPTLEVQIHLLVAFTHMNSCRYGDAGHSLEKARAAATQLGSDAISSQVLSMATMLTALSGDGIDAVSRRRALELEDPDLRAPIVFRASANEVQLRAWEGDLDGAHALLRRIWQASTESGAENDLLFLAVHAVLIAIWRADLPEATALAADAVERAEQLGGDNALLIATIVQTAACAYAGRAADARRNAEIALAVAQRTGAHRVAEWPLIFLGFLAVSEGRYTEALDAIGPLVAAFDPARTEILSASFVPDAIEALVALGRLEEAEPLIAALETNGARFDRPWMLAVGARGRAMWLAASGDLVGAQSAAERALEEHDRLPMPFERARTLLTLGQIRRRRRQRRAASTALVEAVGAFEAIGTALWAERARAELARADAQSVEGLGLTPAEQRVAERAAAGMSNKEIAVDLFIATKTVETNLSSVYRKLNIRSRAQLFARLNAAETKGKP